MEDFDDLVRIGETVDISYVDQDRGGIDPSKTLWEVVSDGQDYIQVGKTEIPSRGYVSQFGFKGTGRIAVLARSAMAQSRSESRRVKAAWIQTAGSLQSTPMLH